MWIEKDIILLPTNKPTHIVKFNWGGKWRLNFSEEILPIQDEEEYQHLYVLSDEDIEDGDWYYWKPTNTIQQAIKDDKGRLPKLEDGSKKIIATTDDDLRIDSTIRNSNELDMDYGKTLYIIPMISKPSIETFVQWYNNVNLIDKVLVEFEEKVIPMDFNGSMGMTEDYEYILKTENNEISIKLPTPLPILKPIRYENNPEHKATIEYGKYLVVRKDGKKHLETFNGTGWAYNDNSIIAYYVPKIK